MYLQQNDKKLVVIIGDTFGFPNGMAATSRVKLIAKALITRGFEVLVLNTRVTERPSRVKNKVIKGYSEGINFEYTTGTTIRHNKFLIRRLIELRGTIRAFIILIGLRKKYKSVVLFLYSPLPNIISTGIFFSLIGKLLGYPIVSIIQEWPFLDAGYKSYIRKLFIPLFFFLNRGIISITTKITELCMRISKYVNKKINIIQVPILVDYKEIANVIESKNVEKENAVLFAGAASYHNVIMFLLKSMELVWKNLPNIKIYFTGFFKEEIQDPLIIQEIEQSPYKNNIIFLGYLPRDELITKLKAVQALLIPLFNDSQSIARFPTKIGEYLSSGTPIITMGIGDLPRYVQDGINGFVSDEISVEKYYQKILEVLLDPIKSEIVGINGKETAFQNFHYENYSILLENYINTLFK